MEILEISKNFADIKFGESNFANGLSSIPGSSRASQLLKDLQIFYDRYTSFFVGTNDSHLRLAVLDTTNFLLFFSISNASGANPFLKFKLSLYSYDKTLLNRLVESNGFPKCLRILFIDSNPVNSCAHLGVRKGEYSHALTFD